MKNLLQFQYPQAHVFLFNTDAPEPSYNFEKDLDGSLEDQINALKEKTGKELGDLADEIKITDATVNTESSNLRVHTDEGVKKFKKGTEVSDTGELKEDAGRVFAEVEGQDIHGEDVNGFVATNYVAAETEYTPDKGFTVTTDYGEPSLMIQDSFAYTQELGSRDYPKVEGIEGYDYYLVNQQEQSFIVDKYGKIIHTGDNQRDVLAQIEGSISPFSVVDYDGNPTLMVEDSLGYTASLGSADYPQIDDTDYYLVDSNEKSFVVDKYGVVITQGENRSGVLANLDKISEKKA